MALNLDANAGWNLLPEVKEFITQLLGTFTNPSSIHSGGQRAKAIIECARDEVGALLGLGKGDRVLFTSGATEANNAVFNTLSQSSAGEDGHLVVSALEHPSVLEPAMTLARTGWRLTLLPPGSSGEFDCASALESIKPDTKLASIMWVNNETGRINPIPEICREIKIRSPGVLMHSDAVQAVGRMKIDFQGSELDYLTISGHKLGGLAGVGALIVREGATMSPLLAGGPQERHLRAGTENVLGIASLGRAARIAAERSEKRSARANAARAAILESLKAGVPYELNTDLDRSVPNTLNIYLPGVFADDLVVAADLEGVPISSGAACSSGKPEPSHVLLGLGYPRERARSSIRISFEPDTSIRELELGAGIIVKCVKRLREFRNIHA
ncbi:MAG: cysteine desulfurase NifS [Proteobacteria bacterium]|nr:MAG: cysteine desulfurase NifS [Pseudomonadota bacterium]